MIVSTVNFKAPVRHMVARVEVFNASTLAATYLHSDALKEITLERIGEENKFFGFGVCQKANVKLIDIERKKEITTENSLKLLYGDNSGEYVANAPLLYVSEVHRDENTNELSITAYDLLYKAAAHTVEELNLTSYTIREFAQAAANLIGAAGIAIIGLAEGESCFDTAYPTGANFDGTEGLREALNAIAEVTQTVYYLNSDGVLVFKRMAKDGAAALIITKEDYITLESSTNRRLATIAHVTELGDNVAASITESGTTQYIRDNPFWDLREDVGTLVNNALSAIGGFTINQFDCKWRGNPLLEIGDRIALITKDGGAVYAYLLNDTLTYNGALEQNTLWSFTESESESETNPSTLGEAIKQTFARVDKANKEIELVASEAAANAEDISSLLINTGSITATVQQLEQNTNETLSGIGEDIAALNTKVEATITAEDVTLQIQSEIANGVEKVVTTTGFTFDETGLNISKSDSEMNTQITEDGMKVFRNEEAVLTANNVGVEAVNLHATTYLIIGTKSRFEDFGENRTGCFWIG